MDILGYEDYTIFRDGTIIHKKNNIFNRIEEQHINPQGYYGVILWKNGDMKNMTVHRLVAQTYLLNPENKPIVDHLNHKRNDNSIENLRWATSSENNENKGKMSTNTSGCTNITKLGTGWIYSKATGSNRIRRPFKTFQSAKHYKECKDEKAKQKRLYDLFINQLKKKIGDKIYYTLDNKIYLGIITEINKQYVIVRSGKYMKLVYFTSIVIYPPWEKKQDQKEIKRLNNEHQKEIKRLNDEDKRERDRKYQRTYYENNKVTLKEENKLRMKDYRKKNKEKTKEKAATYYSYKCSMGGLSLIKMDLFH